MDVADFEAFDAWARGDDAATLEAKRAALEAFCRFHNQTPQSLIAEAKEATKTGAWLHGYTAEARIRQFYAHLTTPTEAGGLGYEREAAEACWRRVRSFYRTHGVETEIEAIASWEAGAPLRSLRSASFEDWDWH
jgi:dienelactone hydrolase